MSRKANISEIGLKKLFIFHYCCFLYPPPPMSNGGGGDTFELGDLGKGEVFIEELLY